MYLKLYWNKVKYSAEMLAFIIRTKWNKNKIKIEFLLVETLKFKFPPKKETLSGTSKVSDKIRLKTS